MKECTNILLVTFSPDENQTLTPIFFFSFLGKLDSCLLHLYRIQGGFREASGRLSRLKVYKIISWFSIILDILEQKVCKVFFCLHSCKQTTFYYQNIQESLSEFWSDCPQGAGGGTLG